MILQWQPTISVLIPAFNVAKYLPKCLDSLQAQTYTNLEIILIDDGSSDDTLQVANAYALKDSRIHVYSYENAGISKTRNRALEHASGELLFFIDSDDFLHKNAFTAMIERMQQTQSDIVQCGFVMDYPFFKLYRKVASYKEYTPLQALHALVKNKGINNYPWAKLFKASCFENVRFPEDVKGFEDTYTIFKAIAQAKKVASMPERFYHYVQRKGSLTNSMSYDTVMQMRKSYHYQNQMLQAMYPNETFDFDLQYFNTDMVIIYTLLLYCSKNKPPAFVTDTIDFSKLWPGSKFCYNAFLLLACKKFKWSFKELGKE
jgi:glycosyltransferase involved in cell wall biosynthesis